MLRWCVRRAFKSASCNSKMSASLRRKNSMIRGSCNPRLMFQLTTLTELGGQRIHRGLAKLPVSISGTEVTTSLFAIVLFAEPAHHRPNEARCRHCRLWRSVADGKRFPTYGEVRKKYRLIRK